MSMIALSLINIYEFELLHYRLETAFIGFSLIYQWIIVYIGLIGQFSPIYNEIRLSWLQFTLWMLYWRL